MSSPPPSVTVRSGTAPRKPGRYCSDSGETFIRGGGGGADVDTCNGFSREVTAVEEISAVGFDRVAAIVKRFLFLEVAAVVAVVWVPAKVGGAKSKCLGRRREEWYGVRRSVEVSMVSRARNSQRERERERQRERRLEFRIF